MAQKLTTAELMQAGKRAVRKGECASVIVAPDHTGEDNYHNCTGRVNHATTQQQTFGELHYCGCSYTWKDSGEITERPNKTVWYATQDGERKSPALDTENDAWMYIQKHQGNSVDYAMRWGGWKVDSASVPYGTPTTNRARYFRVG